VVGPALDAELLDPHRQSVIRPGRQHRVLRGRIRSPAVPAARVPAPDYSSLHDGIRPSLGRPAPSLLGAPHAVPSRGARSPGPGGSAQPAPGSPRHGRRGRPPRQPAPAHLYSLWAFLGRGWDRTERSSTPPEPLGAADDCRPVPLI